MRIASIVGSLLLLVAARAHGDASLAGSRCAEVGIFPTRDGKNVAGPKWRAGRLHLVSSANANDRYSLSARMEHKRPAGAPSRFLLCLGSRVLSTGAGGSDDSSWSFEFEWLDRATADEVALLLHVPRQDRRPLGQGLRWRYRPIPDHPRVGDPLPLLFTVENQGRDTVVFTDGGGHRGSDRENRYRFEIFKNGVGQPDIGSANNFGGLASYVTIAPGQSRALRQVDLKGWGAFAKPGVYEVHCHYDLDLSPSSDFTWDNAGERWELPAEEVIRVEIFAR